ncbi:MAG: hypothetical protein WDO19_06465 [Bacteroidota bacterium]
MQSHLSCIPISRLTSSRFTTWFTREKYKWSLIKTAIVFGAMIGFLWDGLQGGLIEVATF